MSSRDQRHKYDSKLKGFGTMAAMSWFCVMCLTVLPLRLLTSLVGIASADPTAELGHESAPSSLAVADDPNSSLQRQLWRADISLAKDGKDQKSRDTLMRMIEQVRSVRFLPPKPVAESVVVPVEAPVAEPNEALPDASVERQAEQDQSKPRLPYEPITERTLQVLRDLSKDPEKVDSPFDLAETLFLSGNVKEAAVFYTEALVRTDPNDATSSRDRAWVLYQTGNCLRKTDPPVATKMYTRLLTEYPDSPWADIAAAQTRLIDWYLKDEPHKLVVNADEADGK